jgi:hypothetical protein
MDSRERGISIHDRRGYDNGSEEEGAMAHNNEGKKSLGILERAVCHESAAGLMSLFLAIS